MPVAVSIHIRYTLIGVDVAARLFFVFSVVCLSKCAWIALAAAHAASFCVLGVDVALGIVLDDVHPQLVVLGRACSPLEMKKQICCCCVVQVMEAKTFQDELFRIAKFFNLGHD